MGESGVPRSRPRVAGGVGGCHGGAAFGRGGGVWGLGVRVFGVPWSGFLSPWVGGSVACSLFLVARWLWSRASV